MEWQIGILIIFGSLLIVMATGMPVAFCFMLVNLVGGYFLFGGVAGIEQLVLSVFSSLATFSLVPIPLFIIMGELMFHSGLGADVIDLVDQWFGRLPGRMSLMAVGSGVILAALTGVSMASISILGSTLIPEMEKRGYQKPMTIGPILSAGCLAIMVPPSAFAVLLATIGEISVGKLLIAIIIPAILLALLYIAYIVIRCSLQPELAPSYDVPPIAISKKLFNLLRKIVPIAFIVFSVIGIMMLGIATPEEAAASGAIGTMIVAAVQKRLNWNMLKKSIAGTLKITGMIFLIIAGARGFGQITSYIGATQGMAEFASHLAINPIFIVIAMQVIIFIMGCFMDSMAIMLLTIPIFVPTIVSLGFNDVWFGVLLLLNIELAQITPPFGIALFVMKAVAPENTTMADIYKAVLPFIGLQFLAMALIIIFPSIATCLI